VKSASSSPWLSVVMPVYQGEAYLNSALKSIADQGKTDDLEIIIVDDGSTDGSRDIVEHWSQVLPILYLAQAHEGNWIRATNLGLRKARGIWVSLLHQDDCWLPGRLDTLRTCSADCTDVDFWVHPAFFIDEDGTRVGRWRCPLPSRQLLNAADTLPKLVVQNFIPVVSPMVRRAKMDEVGLMNESLWYFGDWDLWLRLASVSILGYVPIPLASFRIHHQSQTARCTSDLDEIGRQFDITVQDALAGKAFPSAMLKRCRRTAKFAKEMYLFLLGGWHGGYVGCRRVMAMGLRLGPFGWLHYWRYSGLVSRLLPRIRLYLRSRKRRAIA
jgi:glycosyltransferase involved in cell wall biosynthesis